MIAYDPIHSPFVIADKNSNSRITSGTIQGFESANGKRKYTLNKLKVYLRLPFAPIDSDSVYKLGIQPEISAAKMALMSLILVVLTFHALADATQFTFTKIGGRIYAETDPEHYAMFGQVKKNNAIQIVSANKEGHYRLKPDCDRDWLSIEKIDEATLKAYKRLRDNYLAEKRGPRESPESYTWTDSFSSDDKREFSAVRLDPNTVVYSSEYFPEGLARVLISGNLVTFVHYDGRVVIKNMQCLYINERILIDGIEKIDPDWKKTIFSSTGDKPLKKHLKRNPIDVTPYGSFKLEQRFSKTDTVEEVRSLGRIIAAGRPVIDLREIHVGLDRY